MVINCSLYFSVIPNSTKSFSFVYRWKYGLSRSIDFVVYMRFWSKQIKAAQRRKSSNCIEYAKRTYSVLRTNGNQRLLLLLFLLYFPSISMFMFIWLFSFCMAMAKFARDLTLLVCQRAFIWCRPPLICTQQPLLLLLLLLFAILLIHTKLLDCCWLFPFICLCMSDEMSLPIAHFHWIYCKRNWCSSQNVQWLRAHFVITCDAAAAHFVSRLHMHTILSLVSPFDFSFNFIIPFVFILFFILLFSFDFIEMKKKKWFT